MYVVRTEYPIAYDTVDTTHPDGAIHEETIGGPLAEGLAKRGTRSLLDLGCAQGRWVAECLTVGIDAIGIDGCNVNAREGAGNWGVGGIRDRLFTCDISRPWQVLHDGKPATFDVVTAWDIMEHMFPWRITYVLSNIARHLQSGGLFLASISEKGGDIYNDPKQYHKTICQRKWWTEVLQETWFSVDDGRREVTPWPHHDCRGDRTPGYWCVRNDRTV